MDCIRYVLLAIDPEETQTEQTKRKEEAQTEQLTPEQSEKIIEENKPKLSNQKRTLRDRHEAKAKRQADVKKLFEDGLPAKTIAKVLGCASNTIYFDLKEMGLEISGEQRQKPGPKPKPKPKPKQEPKLKQKPKQKSRQEQKQEIDTGKIGALYLANWSAEDIADDMGLSVEIVKKEIDREWG